MPNENPEMAEIDQVNIQNILKNWTKFEINDGEDGDNLQNLKIDLIIEPSADSDGERLECGSVYLYDLIELAQRQLRTDNT